MIDTTSTHASATSRYEMIGFHDAAHLFRSLPAAAVPTTTADAAEVDGDRRTACVAAAAVTAQALWVRR